MIRAAASLSPRNPRITATGMKMQPRPISLMKAPSPAVLMPERAFYVKGSAHGHESQRRCHPRHAFQSFVGDRRQRQLQQSPAQTCQNTQQNRIGHHALCRVSQLFPVGRGASCRLALRRSPRNPAGQMTPTGRSFQAVPAEFLILCGANCADDKGRSGCSR